MEERKLEQLQAKLDSLEKALDKVLFYFNSDSMTRRKGIVEKLDDVERMLSDLLVREKIYKAKATIWGMVGAMIVASVWKLITFLIVVLK